MNILVVEDDPTSMKLVHLILEADGHAVKSVDAPEKALASIAEEKPAVVLVDLALPGMDGLSLTRRLKADPATSAIPVVAVTAQAMQGEDAKARAAGCDAYLTKPLDTQGFRGTLRQFLGDQGTTAT